MGNVNFKFGAASYRQTGGSILFAILIFTVLVLASFAAEAGILMLVIGAVHGLIWPALPAFGFWASALIVVALTLIGSFFRSSSS